MPNHSAPVLVRLAALAGSALVLVLVGWAGTRAVAQDEPTRVGRTLPRFEGRLLRGGRAGTELMQSKRGVIFVFSSTDPQVERMAAIIAGLIPQARGANVQLLGINRDPLPRQRFASRTRTGSTSPSWSTRTEGSRGS